MNIAIVDDDFTAQTLIGDYLEDNGYEVIKAYEPDEITATLPQLDVIIMDVMIEHDRTKGLRYIRDKTEQHIITPEKLVIFVSNFGREREEIQNLLNEVDQHIDFKWFDKSLDTAFFSALLQSVQEQSQRA
jgi:DNA-binding response OmpR family regulator